MKYSTAEILNMCDEDIDNLCQGDCGTKNCLFKKFLRKYRENGFCIKQTYLNLDGWIKQDQDEIQEYLYEIKRIKARIKKYKKFKRIMEKEVNNNNVTKD